VKCCGRRPVSAPANIVDVVAAGPAGGKELQAVVASCLHRARAVGAQRHLGAKAIPEVAHAAAPGATTMRDGRQCRLRQLRVPTRDERVRVRIPGTGFTNGAVDVPD
jgi:hypothetical protein